MVETVKKLRLRESPRTDESFMGFLVRLTELNDYEKLSWIVEAAGLNHKILHLGCSFAFGKSVDLSLLADLTGVTVRELSAMTYNPKNESDPVFMSSIFGMAVPKYVIRQRRCKICPLCLLESPYCRRIWDLAPATICLAHKCMLVDECPKCGKRITWLRSKVSVCRCKYDWRNKVPAAVKDSEMEVTKQIYKLCGLPIDESRVMDNPDNNPLLILSLEDFLSAIFFIASQYAGLTDTRGKFLAPTRNNSEIHSLLNKAFKVFEDWPTNYFTFLDWRRLHRRNTRYVGGLRKDFGEYKYALYHQFSSSSFDFLRNSFEEYLRTQWSGGYVGNIKRLGEVAYPKRYLSRVEAQIELKVDFKVIESYIEEGKLKAVIRQQGKNRLILIDAASVEEMRRKFEDHIGIKETASLLGVSLQRVHDLIAHECFKPVRGPSVDKYKIWKFSHKQVTDLLNNIRSKIVPSANVATESTISFAGVLKIFAPCKGFGVGRLVKLILNGEITPCGEGQESGLKAFLFSEQSMREYAWNQQRGINNEGFCITETAKILGIEKKVAYFLTSKGLLPTQKSSNNKWSTLIVTKEGMEFFTSTYVILKDEAKQLKTNTHRLVNLLIQNGVAPVSGPNTDGGHRYLFRKLDLESVNLAILVAEEKEKRKTERDIAKQKTRHTIVKQRKKQNTVRRRTKRAVPKPLSVQQTAEILGLDTKTVNDLAERGCLRPYQPKSKSHNTDTEYHFSVYVIRKYKKSMADCRGLISSSVAAQMLNETWGAFHEKWVRAGYIRPIKPKGIRGGNYFRLEEVEGLIRLKNATVSLREAAAILKVDPASFCKLADVRKVKPVCGREIRGIGYYRFWKSEIEKLSIEVSLNDKSNLGHLVNKMNQASIEVSDTPLIAQFSGERS